MFNEWYARDISKKRRISNKIKGNAGEPMGFPPYGYMKAPDNPKCWIIDDEAAAVVRKIFQMTLDGLGTAQIAAQLDQEGVLTPLSYWRSKGIRRPSKHKEDNPGWKTSSVIKILTTQEYCGDVINFKTYSKSYKNKKRLANDPEHWAVFRDVHEPIISRTTWEQVQEKRGKLRKRKTNNGEHNLFSGFLVCADCGSNLHYHFNQGNPEIQYFNCSNYKGNRGTCSSTHYIRLDFLEQVVLGEIRRLIRFAKQNEDLFLQEISRHSRQLHQQEQQEKKAALYRLQVRDRELDTLFMRIYEDNIAGKLSNDRFTRMSARYEMEQKELSAQIRELSAQLAQAQRERSSADDFVSTVLRFSPMQKLRPNVLHQLIDRIEVHQAQRLDGVYRQKLTIHWRCLGVIPIPNSLPAPAVSVQTRKGVILHYSPERPADLSDAG